MPPYSRHTGGGGLSHSRQATFKEGLVTHLRVKQLNKLFANTRKEMYVSTSLPCETLLCTKPHYAKIAAELICAPEIHCLTVLQTPCESIIIAN